MPRLFIHFKGESHKWKNAQSLYKRAGWKFVAHVDQPAVYSALDFTKAPNKLRGQGRSY